MSTGRIHWKGKNTQGIKHSTSYILNAQQILITVNLFLFSVSLWFWCDAQPHFIEKAIETERSHDTHRMRKIIGNWWLKWGKTYLGCNPGQFMLSPSFSYTFTSSFLPPSAPPTSNIYLPKLQKNPQRSTLCVKLASTGSDKAWGGESLTEPALFLAVFITGLGGTVESTCLPPLASSVTPNSCTEKTVAQECSEYWVRECSLSQLPALLRWEEVPLYTPYYIHKYNNYHPSDKGNEFEEDHVPSSVKTVKQKGMDRWTCGM